MSAGHVYIVNTSLVTPPKDKITICLCASENLFFWINTDPRPHNIGQLKLKKDDHAALSHDCHLDCSRVTTFPPAELATAKHRGIISPELAAQIVDYLTKHPPKTLAPKHLSLAISNLSSLYAPDVSGKDK